MTSILDQTTAVPAGTWTLDPVHSTFDFAVRRTGAALFRGTFDNFSVTLRDGAIVGTAEVSSLRVNDEGLNGHLLSPDFFDAERHPEIRIETSPLRVDGDSLVAEGTLDLKGIRKPIQIRGSISGPTPHPSGSDHLGLSLEAVVDRTEFGVSWNMELPGGGQALSNEVKLTAELELAKEA
jgi:polyisoprenoid-binding protein YceI